jgi:hypothetical protein
MFGVVTTQTIACHGNLLFGHRHFCWDFVLSVFVVVFVLTSRWYQTSNPSQVRHCVHLSVLSSCDKKITRHKAAGDEKSDERVTNWVSGYTEPLAHQCHQRQRLPLGDGSTGSIFILARTLCNSRAEGSQRHCSGLFLQRLEHTLPTGL